VNYTKDQFFDLMAQAEEQGATHRVEVCSETAYDFGGRKPVTFRGCGHAAIFDVPYESVVHDARDDAAVRVCAVEDAMGRWPRFGGDQFGKEVEDD
jgi:hypothetical protein